MKTILIRQVCGKNKGIKKRYRYERRRITMWILSGGKCTGNKQTFLVE